MNQIQSVNKAISFIESQLTDHVYIIKLSKTLAIFHF